MRNFIIKFISTFFFIGYIPFIPGTLASLAGLFLVWFLRGNPLLYLLITAIILFLGFLITSKAEEIFKRKDAKQIVIDEVCGIFLSLLFLPLRPKVIFCAFILFRILDALKIFPAERFQRLSGGKGIMLDDIVAGLYTNIILQLVLRFAAFKIS